MGESVGIKPVKSVSFLPSVVKSKDHIYNSIPTLRLRASYSDIAYGRYAASQCKQCVITLNTLFANRVSNANLNFRSAAYHTGSVCFIRILQ